MFEGVDIQQGGVADETFRLDDTVTLVATYQLAIIIEAIDGQKTVVGAPLAVEGLGGVGEVLQGIELEQRSPKGYAFVHLLGIEGTPVCSHQGRLLDTDHFRSQLHLKGAQHSIVEERTSLYHDMFAQHRGVG